MEALFSVSYTAKFMVKKGPQVLDYAIMPLEELWWADDMTKGTSVHNAGPKEWQDQITASSVGEIAVTTICSMAADSAVGVFDSGIGGLSVLRHIRTQLPHEHLLYFADAGFALYGDKPEAVIVERALAIAAFLVQRGAKALVVACNTATAAAIKALRSRPTRQCL